jgi:hypothetical protein
LYEDKEAAHAARVRGGHASHSAQAEMKRFIRRLTQFSPEEVAESAALLPPGHIAILRALLPDPGDQAET